MSEEINKIHESIIGLIEGQDKITEYLDKNKDGKLDGKDSVLILRDALKETQENFKETVTTMQSNFNTQQENTQKRGMWDKIVTGIILITTFLLSVSL